jgi:hypothetical protein
VLVQAVYNAPIRHRSAWLAWEATKDKHTEQLPPVSVPVWFSHYGTYQGEYANWGHVVAHIPGVGFLSSPAKGVGSEMLGSIQEVERRFNSKYVGWSTDINGLTVAQDIPDPQPSGKKKKMGAFYRSPDGSIVWQEKPNTKVSHIDLTTWKGYFAQGNAFVQLTQAEYDALIKKWGK